MLDSNVIIRVLNVSDKNSLEDLIQSTEKILPNKLFWYPISDVSRAHFWDSDWTKFWGIFIDNELISVAGLFFNANEYGESIEKLHLGNKKVVEIGRIMTKENYKGHGYMTLLLSEVLKYIKTLEVDYAIATVHPDNISSHKVLESIGMIKKAQYVKHEIYLRDVMVLALDDIMA